MNTLKKYKYRLNNLDCANCANKIEERLKKENNLSDVVVNFSSLTLSFMSNDDIKIEDVSDIVTKIEPEVVVTKIDEEVKENKKNYNLIRLIIGVIIALLGLYVFWMPFFASVKYFLVNSLACKLGIRTLFIYCLLFL